MSERSEPGASESDSYCISDGGLTAVADGFGELEKLSLIWCYNVTNAGLRSVAEKCRFLKSLDLQVRYHLSFFSVKYASLRLSTLLLLDRWTSPTFM